MGRARLTAMRLASVATVGVLAACGSSSAHSAAPADPPCGPVGAHTLAASHVARVYVVNRTVFGCSAHGGTSYRLGQRTTCIGAERIDPVRVAGELAAYGDERCGVDTGTTSVVVRRLTNDKQLTSAPATSPPGPESYQTVTSLVLRLDGAVAWIATGHSLGARHSLVEVHKVEKHGASLLDSGPAIGTRSLRLHGSALRWRHGKQTRSGSLD